MNKEKKTLVVLVGEISDIFEREELDNNSVLFILRELENEAIFQLIRNRLKHENGIQKTPETTRPRTP